MIDNVLSLSPSPFFLPFFPFFEISFPLFEFSLSLSFSGFVFLLAIVVGYNIVVVVVTASTTRDTTLINWIREPFRSIGNVSVVVLLVESGIFRTVVWFRLLLPLLLPPISVAAPPYQERIKITTTTAGAMMTAMFRRAVGSPPDASPLPTVVSVVVVDSVIKVVVVT